MIRTHCRRKMSNFLQLSEQHENFTLSLAFLALSFVIFLLKWSPLSSSKKFLPPSPPKFPIIGNLHQVGLHPHRSLRYLAQTHGPVMLLHLGSVPVLVISSAEMACEVIKTHDRVFADRPRSSISEKLLYHRKDIAAAPYGEYWRQMKGLSVLHLLSTKRVQSFSHVREEETDYMIDRVNRFYSSSSTPLNLSEILATLTNDVVCRVALGRKHIATKGGINFKELLGEFVELLGFNIGTYIPWLAWINHVNGVNSRVERVAKELDNFLDGVVEEHMSSDRRDDYSKDFVDVLLWVQKENMAGFPIDRISIKALILDVFSAGTDSTYTVLEWTMTELLRHPKIMKRLQNEVREIANSKSRITPDDLNKMQYLKAVIKETLRLHPPLPLLVPRVSTQDVKLKGFDIAAGTQILINAFAIGRDPASWDRPEEFWPDRFLDSSIDFKGHDFQLLPFGTGRRACPGIQFAISIEELALANLLYKFEWALPSGAREEDLDMTESIGLTTHRKSPLLAVATPYSHQQ
ncbi:cytochrome P450 736A117 [Ricinus communis]|uniref:cytochrome P450 736A117 n=1 Tax=Ricinus communis TaxID=3988 RepID=UPI00201ABD66|nr:cytochrome P450 736A117 [Ricinus communis]